MINYSPKFNPKIMTISEDPPIKEKSKPQDLSPAALAKREAQAQADEEALMRAEREQHIDTWCKTALAKAVENGTVTSSGGTIRIYDAQMKNYLTTRICNPNYQGPGTAMTAENPERQIAETLIKAKFAELGWSARATESTESTGYSRASRSEGSEYVYNIRLTPVKGEEDES